MVEHPCRDRGAHAGHRAGDVFDRLAGVEPDFFAADVDRVAAERRDRHLDRDARARRRLLEQRRDTLAGEHARHARPDRPSTRSRCSRIRVRRPDRDRRLRGRPAHCSTSARIAHRGVDLGIGHEQRRREAQRASASPRSARVRPSRQRSRDHLGVEPGASSAAMSSPTPRTSATPSTLASASDETQARACGALGDVLAFHDVEHRGARRVPRAAGRRTSWRGRRARTRRQRRPAPSTHRSACRCRAPWPSSRCRARRPSARSRTSGRCGRVRSAPRR